MTVPYQKAIPHVFSSSGWWRAVVCRWRGSVYKLVMIEFVGFLLLYYLTWGIMTSFRFAWAGQDGLVKLKCKYGFGVWLRLASFVITLLFWFFTPRPKCWRVTRPLVVPSSKSSLRVTKINIQPLTLHKYKKVRNCDFPQANTVIKGEGGGMH